MKTAIVILGVSFVIPGISIAQTIAATDAMRKIKTTTELSSIPTRADATISAPRNDFEAFQIVVRGPANRVSATASNLIGPGTPLTAASCNVAGNIRLYREHMINITTRSGSVNGGTGGYPDALIPNVDELDQQCRNAFPFDVLSGENRVIWYEVYVPKTAAKGDYTGNVVVSHDGGTVTIPVKLTVWDFDLPPKASLRSYFAISFPGPFAQHSVTPDCGSLTDPARQLRVKYSALGLDHRISTPNVDDTCGFATWTSYDAHYGPLIDGTGSTRINGARQTSVNMMEEDGTAAVYAKWTDHFAAKGWLDRLFLYAGDEPGTCAPKSTPWNLIPPRLDKAHAGTSFRALVVTTIDRAMNPGATTCPPNPPLGDLSPGINILVPNVTELEAKTGNTRSQYNPWLMANSSNEVWQYISCNSQGCGAGDRSNDAWPNYVIDANMIQARALEWLSFKNSLKGELYYDSVFAYTQGDPWANQFFFNGNGDGTLFYPGTPEKVTGGDIPIASLRLKMIREGMEDYELLNILASQQNDREWAEGRASVLFPSGSQTDQDPDRLYEIRSQLASRILSNQAKADPSRPAFAYIGYTSRGAGTGSFGIETGPANSFSGVGGAGVYNVMLAGPNTSVNAATGRITVQSGGTYVVDFHGHVFDGYTTATHVRVRVEKNGGAIGDAYAALGRDSRGTFAGSTTVKANAGDAFSLAIASDLANDLLAFTNLSMVVQSQ